MLCANLITYYIMSLETMLWLVSVIFLVTHLFSVLGFGICCILIMTFCKNWFLVQFGFDDSIFNSNKKYLAIICIVQLETFLKTFACFYFYLWCVFFCSAYFQAFFFLLSSYPLFLTYYQCFFYYENLHKHVGYVQEKISLFEYFLKRNWEFLVGTQ